jgi:hypothetical protein
MVDALVVCDFMIEKAKCDAKRTREKKTEARTKGAKGRQKGRKVKLKTNHIHRDHSCLIPRHF